MIWIYLESQVRGKWRRKKNRFAIVAIDIYPEEAKWKKRKKSFGIKLIRIIHKLKMTISLSSFTFVLIFFTQGLFRPLLRTEWHQVIEILLTLPWSDLSSSWPGYLPDPEYMHRKFMSFPNTLVKANIIILSFINSFTAPEQCHVIFLFFFFLSIHFIFVVH